MKGILKKVVGVLKIARVALPAFVLALSVNAFVQGLKLNFEANEDVDNAKLQILQTEEVVELRERDFEILKKQLDEGTITSAEYLEKKSYLLTTEYADELVTMEGFEKQKAILKQAEDDAKVKRGWGMGIAFGSAVPLSASVVWAGFSYLSSDGRENLGYWVRDGVGDLKFKDPKKKKEEDDALEIKY